MKLKTIKIPDLESFNMDEVLDLVKYRKKEKKQKKKSKKEGRRL